MKDFNFKKSLGQNFLIDKNIVNKIVEESNILPNSLILEIGAGAGALTRRLIEEDARVLAFEIDKRLQSELEKINSDNLEVVFEDFLKTRVNSYIKKYSFDKLFVVANLPYYITTPIITKLIDEVKPYSITIMVQKEVGDRLNAKVNTRNYNSLSVYSQFKYEIRKICDVGKNSFVPKPNVDSIVLNFKLCEKYKVRDESEFFLFVKSAFQYKRKNLRNNLKKYDLKKLEKLLQDLGKDLSYRAEQISIDEFVYLVNNL